MTLNKRKNPGEIRERARDIRKKQLTITALIVALTLIMLSTFGLAFSVIYLVHEETHVDDISSSVIPTPSTTTTSTTTTTSSTTTTSTTTTVKPTSTTQKTTTTSTSTTTTTLCGELGHPPCISETGKQVCDPQSIVGSSGLCQPKGACVQTVPSGRGDCGAFALNWCNS